MAYYDKRAGRLRVVINENGMWQHDYGYGARVECPTGWNDSCLIQTHTVSVEELRDLHYLLGRAIAAADEEVALREAQHRASERERLRSTAA